jgi:hypothetical protein
VWILISGSKGGVFSGRKLETVAAWIMDSRVIAKTRARVAARARISGRERARERERDQERERESESESDGWDRSEHQCSRRPKPIDVCSVP